MLATIEQLAAPVAPALPDIDRCNTKWTLAASRRALGQPVPTAIDKLAAPPPLVIDNISMSISYTIDSIQARTSSTFQAVMPAESFTG